jgi:hypothetical protein
MKIHSDFVKAVHSKTIEQMVEHGKNTDQVISFLKSVWCDDNQIEELLQEIRNNRKLACDELIS